MNNQEHRATMARGFTLTEIIAVLAIIAILATAVIGVGRYAMKRGRIGKAKATLGKLTLGIGLFKEDFGVYIPDSVTTENGKSLANLLNQINWPASYTDALGRRRSKPSPRDYDKPSEILFFFLQEMYDVMNFNARSREDNKKLLRSLPRKTAYVKFKRNELADTDEPRVRRKPGPPEIVDGWGIPFLYVAADEDPDERARNVEPHQGKNPESFSLYSFGPDKSGYYSATTRGERDYPAGDLNYDGKSDSSDTEEMKRRVRDLGQREADTSNWEKACALANKDNITNWQRED